LSDISAFVKGFGRFQEKYFADSESIFDGLREGQNPSTLVISCCDSRTDPGMLMGANPGDIFVVRNVANLVPPYSDGSEMPGIRADIEFAIKGLNVSNVIILGHSGCGGIRALMDGEGITENRYEFIGRWVTIARGARDRVFRELATEPDEIKSRACEHWAIELSLKNLMTFPWIRERVESGALKLHGWYFDIRAGELLGYSPDRQEFAPLVPRTESSGRGAA
jgi:carbonic anhydrase